MSKILIVEDEKKIARFIELELTHEGYEVQAGERWSHRACPVRHLEAGSSDFGLDAP